MYSFQHPLDPDDSASSGQLPWKSDLPHHFPQSSVMVKPTALETRHGIQPAGLHSGLNHLASAAAISDPYNTSQTSPPSQRTSPDGPSAFVANEGLSSTMAPTAAQQREQQKAKRRVPNSLRKRTQISCDNCKTRRCKCIRLNTASESYRNTTRNGSQPPCKLCVESGIPCVTTMPRKQRVYGSVENLDRRYRALEALVFGLFPQLNPKASAEELVIFGRERAVAMPEFSESSDQASLLPSSPLPIIKPEYPETSPQQERDQARRGQSSNLIAAGTNQGKTILPPSYVMRGMSATTPEHSPEALGAESNTHPNNDRSGLILDASGRPHYIGPCGSLAFFAEMRDLFSLRFSTFRRRSDEDKRMGCSFTRDRESVFVNNPLAASLGGTGDRGRLTGHVSGKERSPSRDLECLEGDSPPQLCEDMLRAHPDDPEFWRYRKRVSALELPPRKRADTCVEAFFTSVHPNFILFHRLTFQKAYEKMWKCWDANQSRKRDGRMKEASVSVGWLCCLYMIFVIGSRALPQSTDSLEFQRKWFAAVDKLPPLLGTASLPNVCAYMLLSLYYHNTNDRTSSWTFHGAACRLAIALGMHRESSSGLFDPVERQLRKLVWWTLYDFEQFLCCSLGRPSAIDDREMDVGIPKDAFLDANLLPPHYIEYSAQLNMLLAAVRRGIFDPSFVPGTTYSRALDFLDALKAWEISLPRGLRPMAFDGSLDGNDNQWRSAMLLHIRYHHVVSFLARPFLFEIMHSVIDGVALGPDASKFRALSQVCLTGAMRGGEYIINLWRAGYVNGVTWIDIYYAHMACLDIALALLSPDALFQNEEHPDICKEGVIQKYTTDEMRSTVRQLCEVMSTTEVCGTNARFAKAAFEFASALAIIPEDKYLSLRLRMPDPESLVEDEGIDKIRTEASNEDQAFPHPRKETKAGELDQIVGGIPGYAYATNDMNLDFSGNFNNAASTAVGNGVQWDM
ncbi:hypothetical protein F4819DRAFT_89954 [Hypoxylon fuscum]|nr:hypothetical protein F4819DRAFT_89954 [Hypoxylon fuscum]